MIANVFANFSQVVAFINSFGRDIYRSKWHQPQKFVQKPKRDTHQEIDLFVLK